MSFVFANMCYPHLQIRTTKPSSIKGDTYNSDLHAMVTLKLRDMIYYVTLKLIDVNDHVTLKMRDVIYYVTPKLDDVNDHVTLKLSDLIDHVTMSSDLCRVS